MRRRSWILLSSVVVIIALCVAFVIAATASASPSSTDQHRRLPGLKQGTALNWSGYAAETSLTSPASQVVTDVKGQWVVPKVTGSYFRRAYSSVWVGIDGYSSSTVEQIGTEQDWTGFGTSYYAWYEMYPAGMVNVGRVYPGDAMTAEVSSPSAGTFVLTITDTTTAHHFTFTITKTLSSALRSSAEWVAEAPSSSSGVLPLANFGTMTFSGAQATINGHTGTISDASWQNDLITMVTSGGTVKAAPGSLTGGGTGFSVTWHHS